jgi:flavin reductase (DIM6/NTAB) family NADH-FMN oxidoreductase RutF
MPAEKVEAPLIEECIGHLECRVWQVADAGDHTLFMGSVLTAWVEEALFDERWKIEEDVVEGLHHLGGRHFAVSSRRISVED